METVSIKQLSEALPWRYRKISDKCCRPELNKFIYGTMNRRAVRVEDMPKFLEVLYEVMGRQKPRVCLQRKAS